MATPSYTTDLTNIVEAESGETWGEPAGATGGGVPSAETDYFIQKSYCFSKTMAIAGGGIGGMGTLAASPQTITSPAAVFVWIFFACPNTLDSQANGGLRVIVGSDSSNYNAWYVKGSNTYTYGGWFCVAVDPSVSSQATQGSPTSTLQYFGTVAKTLVTISKGNPFGTDAIRFGRLLQVTGGETSNYATFAGAATKNDANDATDGYNRWGLFQVIAGGYLQQGLFLMGTSGTAVDFRDSNRTITIQDTIRVTSGFNEFEIRNASSRIDWTNIQITALGTTSKGKLTVTDNADVNFDTCTFSDMDTFVFQSNSTILTTIFRRCGLVTQGGAVFTGCRFENSTASASILSNNLTNISNCTFVSDGSNHAIEINTAGTYSFSGNTFTGYAASNGSTGNEVIYNNSSGEVIINYSGGSGVISYRNGTGATTTVASSVNLIINIVDADGNAVTANCEVTVVKASDESVLFTEDNITDGSTTYSYSSGAGTTTYINIHNVTGYQSKTVNNYALPSSNTTLTVQLDTDPFYSNP
ncbi:MAG: hypothetical protein PHE48_04285 [Candidatus Daviesbacteria bacterium]|nr:hypothetical protein [Candidatus Daviesbacteria bacterium]